MHKKEKTDAARAKVFTKIGKEMAIAVREGGPDPVSNSKLRDLIAKAKANNVPNDNIDRAIKKGSGELGDAVFEEITYEGYGPGGAAVIVQALTVNKNRTAGDVRHIFDKNGGNLGTNGCVSYLFERAGRILIEKSDDIDEDELMMVALDAGAEDMETSEDGYEIKTAPADFANVLDQIQAAGYKVASGEIAQIPSTETELSDEDGQKMEKMLDMFEDNDDVQEVFHNWAEA